MASHGSFLPDELQPPRASSALVTTLGAVAAFCAYFCMYAFRKPIAAAEFSDIRAGWLGIDYKTLVIIAQVAGYAASKLIGVRVIAEAGRRGRGKAIIALIALSWAALILFAIVPAPWNAVVMILNGLPLGMIWGLVFSYLEGRRNSELLGAILCASFILSSGVVKSVATLLMAGGIGEFWMPAATGVLFFPLLFGSVAVLERLPPPSAEDERERAPRVPMDGTDRRAFLREHGLALILLVAGYVLLTAIRDFRDNFAAELWAGLGYSHVAAVFSASEIPVGDRARRSRRADADPRQYARTARDAWGGDRGRGAARAFDAGVSGGRDRPDRMDDPDRCRPVPLLHAVQRDAVRSHDRGDRQGRQCRLPDLHRRCVRLLRQRRFAPLPQRRGAGDALAALLRHLLLRDCGGGRGTDARLRLLFPPSQPADGGDSRRLKVQARTRRSTWMRMASDRQYS
jgi:hypothetical protein